MSLRVEDTALLKAQNIILEMIATGQSLPAILLETAKKIEEIIPGSFCSIHLLNEKENTLENGIGPSIHEDYHSSLHGTKIGPAVGSCGTAAFYKKMVIVEDIETDLLWQDFHLLALAYGLRSCWSKPVLSSSKKVLGTFAVYYSEPKKPGSGELYILDAFTNLTSIAIEHRKTDEKLFESEKQYRLLAENVSDFVGILNEQGVYEYISSSHKRDLGYESCDLIGKVCFDYIHPDDAVIVKKAFRKMVYTNKPKKVEYRFKHQEGYWVYLEGKGEPMKEAGENLKRYVFMARDITEKKLAEQHLKKAHYLLEEIEQKFYSLYHNSLDAIFEMDVEGNYINVNQVAETLTGYSKEELLSLSLKDLLAPEEWIKAANNIKRLRKGKAIREESCLIHKDGHQILIEFNAVPVFKDNGTFQVIAFTQDITDKRQAEEEIKALVFKDILTGIPNRFLFSRKLKEAIKKAEQNKALSFGILFIDFDNFKTINDTLGHNTGDKLLQRVVVIMQNCLRKTDLISRQGGDEFLLLIEDASKENVGKVAERILCELNKPIRLDGHEIFITPSIGISMFSDGGLDAENLIKYADLAMYAAKESGKNNYQFYSETLNQKVHRRSYIENSLRKALEKNQFTLHYQTKFDLDTKKIEGIEALLRWNTEDGFVSPMEFIPVAEETGMIVQIGEWVLREACKQSKSWRESGLLQVPVAVNVSARQLKEPDFIRLVAHILQETNLPPHQLEIEITESVMIDIDKTMDMIKQLRKIGVRVAIDDFGVGYSSLNMIKAIDFDNIKIDQSFLHDVMKDKKSAGLLEAIIHIGREIGSGVVVEGVETKEQAEFLKAKGVIGQGYYFSRPLPAGKLEKSFLNKL